MKTFFLAAVLALTSFTARAETPVAGSGQVGAARVLDWDTNAAIQALVANPTDFSELMANGHFLTQVKIEILPAETSYYSAITRFTFTASERGSILGSQVPLKHFQLVLDSYFDKRIMDDTPTIWRSSGVTELPAR